MRAFVVCAFLGLAASGYPVQSCRDCAPISRYASAGTGDSCMFGRTAVNFITAGVCFWCMNFSVIGEGALFNKMMFFYCIGLGAVNFAAYSGNGRGRNSQRHMQPIGSSGPCLSDLQGRIRPVCFVFVGNQFVYSNENWI